MGISYDLFQFIEMNWNIDLFAKKIIRNLGDDYAFLLDIPVGFLPLGDFDAFVKAPNNKHIILICLGLPLILTSLNQSIVQMIQDRDRDIFIYTAATCACAIKFGYFEFQWPESPPDLLKSKDIINSMVDSQMAFVLLHEYSHVLFNHRIDTDDPKEELDADRKAIELFGKLYGNEKEKYYSSIYLLLELMMLFDIMFPRISPSPTHPPALNRWNAISKTWACIDTAQLQVVKGTEKIFEALKSYLKSAIDERRETDPNFWKNVRRGATVRDDLKEIMQKVLKSMKKILQEGLWIQKL
jgi:hypothetical protein